MAIAAAEGLLQARCGLSGHTMAKRFEKTRVSLAVPGLWPQHSRVDDDSRPLLSVLAGTCPDS